MRSFRFEYDWVDAENANGPELSATWASLRIVVYDSIVTRVVDNRAKTVRDSIYVSIYPLAEWLATNWWFLATEYPNREKLIDPEFLRRHSLISGREGYALPDLKITSYGGRTNLIWNRCAPEWTKVEFLEQGRASVGSEDFRQACAELIEGVVRRLEAVGIQDTLLQNEWHAIQRTETDREEREFCETVAGLGWDPYDLEETQIEDVLSMAEALGELTDEAVQVVDPKSLLQQSSDLISAIEVSKKRQLPLHHLNSDKNGPEFVQASGGTLPWEIGYQQAQHLRQQLHLDGQPIPTMEKLGSALGVDGELVEEITKPNDILANMPLIDGVVTINDDQNASFAFRRSSDPGRRFAFCRGISEVISFPLHGGMLTQSYSERQQRNRAFAAEFLAPSFSLRERITRQVVDDEEVEDLAEEFGVSPFVINHQIDNHQIAQLAEPVFA